MDLTRAIEEVEAKRTNLRFARALIIAQAFFGKPRVRGSHHVFRMPWGGNPRIVLVSAKGGRLKRYQVEDVLKALVKLRDWRGDEEEGR